MKKRLPRTIPIYDLSYEKFDEHLDFYTALGFESTYYQRSPYRYASMEKENLGEIGFFGNKALSEAHPSGCVIEVEGIDNLYEELRFNLKTYYGKIPTKGKPRFSRINQTAEDRRINITDPSGNSIVLSEPMGDAQKLMEAEDERVKKLSSRYEKAYAQAYRYIYSKEDFQAGNYLITAALSKKAEALNPQMIFKGKVLQLEAQLALGHAAKVQNLARELAHFEVDETGIEEVVDRMKELVKLE